MARKKKMNLDKAITIASREVELAKMFKKQQVALPANVLTEIMKEVNGGHNVRFVGDLEGRV